MADEAREGLFPALPEDLSPEKVSDEDLARLISEHEEAKNLIDADDTEFLSGYDANEVLAQYEAGAQSYKLLTAESKLRYLAKKAEIADAFKAEDEPEPEGEGEGEEAVAEAPVEVVAEAEAILAEAEEEAVEVVETEKELVLASVEAPPVRLSRTPPAPSPQRVPKVADSTPGTALVASSQFRAEHPEPLDQSTLSSLMRDVAIDLGPVAHDGKLVQRMKVDPWQIDTYADGSRVEIGGGEMQWDGPKTKVARADFEFPEERTLGGNSDDYEKIRAVLPNTVQFLGQPGGHGGEALVASGGLCAPLTPIYSMPNFGTEAEPVWDSFPVFRANRGGVNVPTPTYVADITTAISSISAANDALGGTFATKSCQDLTCPAYTETAVNIFAHCREYGNLNARAWPEKIAHENALTMQALSRVSEGFMLDRAVRRAVSVGTVAPVVVRLRRAVEHA